MLLKFFRKGTPTNDTTPINIIPHSSQPPGTYPIQTAKSLLEPRLAAINRIEELAGVPSAYFQQFYLDALSQYAQFVQLLPASESHHHAYAGGLLDHTLEVVASALTLRQGYLLPAGAEAEHLVHKKDIWTYAVFAASLCHDLAKPIVDQSVQLFDAKGKLLDTWNPWFDNLNSNQLALWYSVSFVRGRIYRLHEKAALLFANRILPATGLSWLASDQQVLFAWLSCVSGDFGGAGEVGELCSLADRQSVAQNLGAENSSSAVKPQTIPLHVKLVTALRQLLEDHTLPLNRNGAAGWRCGNTLWLVSKRVADILRLSLSQSGHTGIPSDNQRLFDVLQEQGILTLCRDRAICRASIQGDGWSHELTLIGIPLIKLWSNSDDWPEEFSGSVVAQSQAESESAIEPLVPEENKNSMVTEATDTALELYEENQLVEAITHSTAEPVDAYNGATTSSTDDQTTINDINCTIKLARQQLIKPENSGMQFMEWVIQGIEARSLNYNNPGARVHVVEDGVLLASPGIFQDFANHTQCSDSWESVQKRFIKLGLHQKADGGINVHKYQIIGKHQSGQIIGVLLQDPSLLFKNGKPSPNPYIRKPIQ